jgi:hypothetical protein
MQSFLRYAVCSICFGFVFAVSTSGDGQSSDEYQQQQEKLSRATSPMGKVKVLIKMSDLDIGKVSHWVKKGNLLEADQFLNRYMKVIKQTSEILKASHRDAQKNPAGFKDFEMSLRRQLRKLADLKLNYSFDQQEAINQAIGAAESAKEEMLKAIFGPENAGRKRDRSENPAKDKEQTQ